MNEQAKIELFIDGQPCSTGKVYPFYRYAPFPGDHTDVLTVQGEDSKKRLLQNTPFSEQGTYERLNRESCMELFRTLDWSFLGKEQAPTVSDENEPYRYFLNSIRVMIVSADKVHIEGICSTVLKQANQR